MKKIILLIAVVILGVVIINKQKSEVKYVDFDCPYCESTEVLDFGTDEEGNQNCHCADCNKEFSIKM